MYGIPSAIAAGVDASRAQASDSDAMAASGASLRPALFVIGVLMSTCCGPFLGERGRSSRPPTDSNHCCTHGEDATTDDGSVGHRFSRSGRFVADMPDGQPLNWFSCSALSTQVSSN